MLQKKTMGRHEGESSSRHKRKSHHRSRSRSRSRSRERRRDRESSRRSREDESDRKRSRGDDGARSSSRRDHQQRDNGSIAPAAGGVDILQSLAASISAKALQQENAQFEAVEAALDGAPAASAATTAAPSSAPSTVAASASPPPAADAATAAAAAAAAAAEAEQQAKRKQRLEEWRIHKEKMDKQAAEDAAEAARREQAVLALSKMPANGMSLSLPSSNASKRSSSSKAGASASAFQHALSDEEDDDDEDDATFYQLDARGRPLPRAGSMHADPSVAAANTTNSTAAADEEDIDPLDAYMQGLEEQEAYVPQETMSSAFGVGDTAAASSSSSSSRPVINGFKVGLVADKTTISFEEIMQLSKARGTFIDDSDATASDVEGGTAMQLDDDDAPQQQHTNNSSSDPSGYDSSSESPEARAAREAQEEEDRQQFMAALRAQRAAEEEELKALQEEERAAVAAGSTGGALGRLFADDGDIVDESALAPAEKDALQQLAEANKKKELKPVDHSAILYPAIRKNLYIVPRKLALLTEEQKQAIRSELEIKIRGRGCPPPVETWEQCGLSDRMLSVLQNAGFTAPFAIQRQAIPALMAGRDVIGVARTGSGKTLAFLLPLFRQVLDQPPLAEGEGPIGIIMAPARELAVQIYTEAKKFAKAVGRRVTAVYGGAGIKDQIGELKRGADIVVCTPGRMIDILTMQAGKLISMKRVSFVVMDEADRMFDMGFEPQINMILQNIRPDRQVALFSATFPTKVEALARKVLKESPLEITVGGRSVASDTIEQHVEVREEDDKYERLLQLLGHWYERGNVLVFVDSQAKVDTLFSDLARSGYPALTLHGGKEQDDRESSISDFKKKISTLMVATSVAGRGLDVPDLVCVINYSCPNHLEDYVHRVGRTGRAGRSGTAYTFISPEEEQHAPTLIKALQQAKQTVPPELQAMADAFAAKVSSGQARKANSGFAGKGFTFDDSEMTAEQAIRAQEKRQYQIEAGMVVAPDREDLEAERRMREEESDAADALAGSSSDATAFNAAAAALDPVAEATARARAAAAAQAAAADPVEALRQQAAAAAKALGLAVNVPAPAAAAVASSGEELTQEQKLEAAKRIAAQVQKGASAGGTGALPVEYDEVIYINDYPQPARWKVVQKDSIGNVADTFGVSVITRGIYLPPGKQLGPNEDKLNLRIVGTHKQSVQSARAEVERMLKEETLRVAGSGGGRNIGKYSVV